MAKSYKSSKNIVTRYTWQGLKSIPAYLFILIRLGEGEQDHGELLLGDLAVSVEVASLHDRLLKVLEVIRVVVLENVVL